MEIFSDKDLLLDKSNQSILVYHVDGSTLVGSVRTRTNVATPIPLSPDVLVACGFNENEKCDYFHTKGLCVHFSLNNFFECEGTQISYLHNLQQIFREKFKEEMEIDLKKLLQVL